MSTPDPDPADPAPLTRRTAVEGLAAAIRRLGDVAVETAVEPEEIAAVTRAIDDLTARLGVRLDTSPFSGLTGPNRDYSTPDAPMPLNPIIGACSPVRPDVTLVFEDGEVRGTATFSKRFVGPPGFAHGGISAMLADQLVSVSSVALGVGCVTKALHVRYRRPLPLGVELTLVGRCTRTGDEVSATCEVRVGDTVAVEGTAELVPYEVLARSQQRQQR